MSEGERQEPDGAADAAAHHPFETERQAGPDGLVASLTGAFDGLAAEQALAQGRRCVRQLDLQFLHLGALLSTIRRKKWHRPGNFREFAAQSLGLKKSRAAALLRVFETSARLGLNAADVAAIGWTKMQLVAPHLTPDTVGRLLPLAREQSRAALIESLGRRRPPRRAKAAVDDTGSISLDEAGYASLSKALNLARELHGLSSDAAALVAIGRAYLKIGPITAGLQRRRPEDMQRVLNMAASAYGRDVCIAHLRTVSAAPPTNVHPAGQTGPPKAPDIAR